MTNLNPFKITHAQASAAILKAVRERTLIQKSWHTKGADGREMACLLGSIHPKVQQPSDCNGDLMPLWLAETIPGLFDGIDPSKVFDIAERAGLLINQWHVITEAGWDRVRTKFLCRLIDDAVESVRPVSSGIKEWAAVEQACKDVVAALESGDKFALEKARDAAYAAAGHGGAAANAANTAYAAAYAATNAANAAAYAANAAAYAANAANAAAYATNAAYAATNAATNAAYARIFSFLLDIIEQEIQATPELSTAFKVAPKTSKKPTKAKKAKVVTKKPKTVKKPWKA